MSIERGQYTYPNDPKFSDRQVLANSVDPDQTAFGGVVWSGSTLLWFCMHDTIVTRPQGAIESDGLTQTTKEYFNSKFMEVVDYVHRKRSVYLP